MWGVFAVGLFASPNEMALAGYNSELPGAFFGGGGALLGCQVVAILWIIGWVTCIMTPFFILLNFLNMFRVDALEEEVGLDISHHRGSAYDISGPSEEAIQELMEERASKHGKVEVPKEVAQAAEEAEEPDVEVDAVELEQTA
jgi:Amt family ammonium transporter